MGNHWVTCARPGLRTKVWRKEFAMSNFFYPIHPLPNNNNNSSNNQEDYTMNNPITPNYTNISDMPGINGLILDLENKDIIFGDRLLTHMKNGQNLIVLGSFFNKVVDGIREYDYDSDETVAEYDAIEVYLLLAIGESHIMWVFFQYAVDKNGNYKDVDTPDYWYCRYVWGVKNGKIIRDEFIKVSCGMEANRQIFEYPTEVCSDRSHRYDPIKWIQTCFSMASDFE